MFPLTLSPPSQIYAVVVGALSAVTCVAYFLPFVLRAGGIVMAAWDFVLFVLWIGVLGVFGKVHTLHRPLYTYTYL